MIKLKSLLTENPFDKLGSTSDANRITGGQRDPKTGNLINNAPKDNIIKIDGSEPYVTVTYNDGGNTVVIKFDDYELHDRVNANVWVGTIEGTDNKNQAWRVDAEAVELGGGDYDWEIDWDTIEKI
jgi:hypothetical protein